MPVRIRRVRSVPLEPPAPKPINYGVAYSEHTKKYHLFVTYDGIQYTLYGVFGTEGYPDLTAAKKACPQPNITLSNSFLNKRR